VLVDQLQSEQGARFYRKRNRNIIVEVRTEIEVLENFCWLTLGQIQKLIATDNLVNMDSRTVISGIPFGHYDRSVLDFFSSLRGLSGEEYGYPHTMLLSALTDSGALHSVDEVISWITRQKSRFELHADRIPLQNVVDWERDERQIRHVSGRYFSVIAAHVEISNREVTRWFQPLIRPAQEGIIAFIVKKINGVIHFLVQAKVEAGNLDIVEMAPTVQCITDNYRNVDPVMRPPFLDYVLAAKPEQIRHSSLQSEEGGRFYQEQNRNLIVEVGDEFDSQVPENYIWMTLHQMKSFIRYNNYLNIQSRSLMSGVPFI
jgi:oxidase EvaA